MKPSFSNVGATRLLATVLIALSLPALPSAEAVTLTWNTTTGIWDIGTTPNWTGSSTTWTNGNQAVFGGNSNYTVTINGTVSAAQLSGTTGPHAVDSTNTGTTTITGGTLTLTGANATINHASAMNVSSVIAGTVGLRVSGTSAITLGAVNTYTGTTTIASGTLRVGIANALPTGTDIVFGGSARTLDINGFNTTVSSLAGSNGVLTNNSTSTAATITLSGSVNTSTGATITNGTRALSLVKNGTGTQTLTGSGALSYTGSTTISAGTLLLSTANSNLTATSAVTINGGTLASGIAAGNLNLGVGDVVMSSGAINPGDVTDVASFTLAANKNFTTTGGTININLDTTASLDQIIGSGSGAFSLTNTSLALNLLSWTASDYNNVYAVFSGFNSGSIANLTITGYDTANYAASLGSNGVLSFAAVPEPSTMALMVLGAGVVIYRTRRRVI